MGWTITITEAAERGARPPRPRILLEEPQPSARPRRRVYICSRYAGDVERNVQIAERLCLKAMESGFAPFAPHLLYTRFLDDQISGERERGIQAGLAFIEVCDEVWCYTGDGISEGMRRELALARDLGIPVVDMESL